MSERWRDVIGTDGTYQVSDMGNVRRFWKVSRKRTPVKPFTKRTSRKGSNRKSLKVRMTMPDGKRIERTILTLVAEAFLGIRDGMAAVHRNGLYTDNTLQNVMLMSRRNIGTRYGKQGARRPVIMIDDEGGIVAAYSSAREAAKQNHMSYQTVMDRCNRKVKKEYALNGCTFRWDDRKNDMFYEE